MTLEEAIIARHSVRDYQNRPVEAEKLSAIQKLIDTINQETGLNIQMVINNPVAFASGIVTYGKFHGVNNYLAMVGPKGRKSDESIGYYGEQIVLMMQTLGLNSCWVGQTFKNDKSAYQRTDKEELKCVIAFGYGATQGIQHPQKKTITDVAINKTNKPFPEWFERGINAALLAPTAVNQHKYEFVLHEENRVEAKTKFSWIGYTHIDLGIVKCHFELAAGKENFKW
ncbi:MAG: nitroreductase [Paludibacteraceae bacterium]|nr:nitroreductase [Paludibacteraceae bacterium]